MRLVRVGLVQMASGDEPAGNLERAIAGVEEAARRGAAIACLPELFRTRYFPQAEDPAIFDLAEEIPGPTTRALSEAAARLRVAIVTSVFERRAPGLYHNTAVVLDADGSLRGAYRKMHIPHDPLYYEKYYFAPGDTGFVSVATSAGRVAPLVCWDQWFPEAARIAALKGAEILVYPTAIGWHHREKAEWGAAQLDAWRTIQRAHAIANGVFVAAVNRVGVEGGLEFWGSSFLADPFGRVLASCSERGFEGGRPEVAVADCALETIEETRRHWPFFRDRRVDAYGDIVSRHLAP
ncbi:MAG: carbon-nitrogen hydrolase [Planctomycetota bacterium]